MPFTIIDASGPILSARVSGELSRSEVSQMQAAVVRPSAVAISRSARLTNTNGLPEAHPANDCCSGVRAEPVCRPSDLTSWNSIA